MHNAHHHGNETTLPGRTTCAPPAPREHCVSGLEGRRRRDHDRCQTHERDECCYATVAVSQLWKRLRDLPARSAIAPKLMSRVRNTVFRKSIMKTSLKLVDVILPTMSRDVGCPPCSTDPSFDPSHIAKYILYLY